MRCRRRKLLFLILFLFLLLLNQHGMVFPSFFWHFEQLVAPIVVSNVISHPFQCRNWWERGEKKCCIGRESNPGRPRSAVFLTGRRAFYHWTTDASWYIWFPGSKWIPGVKIDSIGGECGKKMAPMRGIEPRPRRWKRRILTTRPHGMAAEKIFQ